MTIPWSSSQKFTHLNAPNIVAICVRLICFHSIIFIKNYNTRDTCMIVVRSELVASHVTSLGKVIQGSILFIWFIISNPTWRYFKLFCELGLRKLVLYHFRFFCYCKCFKITFINLFSTNNPQIKVAIFSLLINQHHHSNFLCTISHI